MLLSRKNESTGKNLLMMTCDANCRNKTNTYERLRMSGNITLAGVYTWHMIDDPEHADHMYTIIMVTADAGWWVERIFGTFL